VSTKAEREKDKAICEAATPPPWIHEGGRMFRCRPNGDSVPARTTEDALFMVRARECLPAYIADAEETERRVTQVEKLLAQTQERVAISRGAGMMVHALEDEQRASLYSEVLCILRGVS
jgi:hypothetical protein